MSTAAVVPIPTVYQLNNTNNEYLVHGPCVDGLTVNNNPPTYVTDLVITATLYINRDIYNPAQTPGTVVTAFGTGGSIVMTYSGSQGIYTVLIPSFTAAPGTNYVLVLDAPTSISGYQGHWEKSVTLTTRQS